MNDKISLLLDQEVGAAERARLWSEVALDAEARATWERYHTIRALVRHEVDWTVSAGFADRVAGEVALEERPPVRAGRWLVGRRGWASRFAVAGSVAALALLGLRFSLHPATESAGSNVPLASVAPLASGLPIEDASLKNTVHWDQLSARAQRRLNGLLLEHSEFAPQGADGLIGYVRIVGYDRARQSTAKK